LWLGLVLVATLLSIGTRPAALEVKSSGEREIVLILVMRVVAVAVTVLERLVRVEKLVPLPQGRSTASMGTFCRHTNRRRSNPRAAAEAGSCSFHTHRTTGRHPSACVLFWHVRTWGT
jgi:hypothetical protein